MVERRCAKPPEGVVRRLTLLETVIQGMRAHVNKVRLEIFRPLVKCICFRKNPYVLHIILL